MTPSERGRLIWKVGDLHAARAGRRRRPDHPVELPAADGRVEARAGARLRVHGRDIVTGFGDAGAALSAHDDVDKVAFTGSTEVGKLIVQAAAGNLKKVSLELGGKSPNVVYADADIEAAIPGAANAIFFNHGQCCTAGSRLFVEERVFDDVVGGIADQARQIRL